MPIYTIRKLALFFPVAFFLSRLALGGSLKAAGFGDGLGRFRLADIYFLQFSQ